jgi:hypothetical protein
VATLPHDFVVPKVIDLLCPASGTYSTKLFKIQGHASILYLARFFNSEKRNEEKLKLTLLGLRGANWTNIGAVATLYTFVRVDLKMSIT